MAAHAQLRRRTGFSARPRSALVRRSYATNLQTEYGYDVSFVQLQLGHEHAATTSIYTLAAPDYRARELERVLSTTLTRSNADLAGTTRKESQ
ncbi:phage integrase family protein [Skermania sp. ID1734]|uniref:tyrosine-type recombinase/integrase n=1 Tax=Skermania sp. ID1734 TaxID=2597516 RepID=UPI00117D0F6F|nr:phage integrase family protein [Skermania sp. ID1734]